MNTYAQSKCQVVRGSFKYRRKLGLDIALEALRLYHRGGSVDVSKLLGYARICRVERMKRPYLEALLGYQVNSHELAQKGWIGPPRATVYQANPRKTLGACFLAGGEAFLETHFKNTNTMSDQDRLVDRVARGEYLAPTRARLRRKLLGSSAGAD
jgi:hypothetical protein